MQELRERRVVQHTMTKSRPQNHKQKKQTPKTRRSATVRKARSRGKPSPELRFAHMLNNPCGEIPSEGIYGNIEGMGASFNTSLTNSNTGMTCGFIAWSPNYCASSYNAAPRTNLLGATYADPTSTSVNISTLPAYIATPFSSNLTFRTPDPAAAFAQQSLCAGQRVLACCMTMEYIGKLVDLSGQVCFFENITNDVMSGNDQLGFNTPSVNAMFDLAGPASGMMSKHEVKYRLDENSHVFQEAQDGPMIRGASSVSASVPSPESLPVAPTWYGIAWRGMDANVSPNLAFRFTKHVEWKPSRELGLKAIPPVTTGPSLVSRAQAILDKANPDWWHTAASFAGRAASGYLNSRGMRRLNA